MDGWKGALEAATVALDLPDGGGGTGFVLAPGVVVTCAHVVAGADRARGRIAATGHDTQLTVSSAACYRTATGLDVAVLRGEAEGLSPVLTSPHVSLGDRMAAYGHPRGDFRAGQWAALEYQGDSRLSFDDAMPMPRVYGTPVGQGCSGSPVVNHRTGAVCGMLVTSDSAGSAHMVPVAEILARCPASQPPVGWLRVLTDEQVRAGEFRYPGPRLRDYLAAARDGADEHPYASLQTDVGNVPLSRVYVRQEASQRDGAAGKDGTAAESVLESGHQVLFTGGAGSGKSSLLRRLTLTAASAWLEEPEQAPPYLPVRVAADQLLDLPFPEAVATAVARDLPGLRRSLPADVFGAAPLPSVDWLVCVDGLDEVLDPEARREVIKRLQRWAQEPYLRFVVASRSLLHTEMERLNALRRYALLPLGDLEIQGVARAWFEALKVPDAARRATELVGELRHGRLDEVSRNPLTLTMICVVAALSELPRNPADLYGRFVRILRDKGAQRLDRTASTAHGITSDLLDRMHEVLRRVAEQRQGGDARPLLDQVLELLAPEAPSKDLVLRALTFTGLVTQRGGELSFPHQTVQEYLAGCAIAERLSPKDPEALRIIREEIAAERPNMALFMAAHWHEQGMPLKEFLRTTVDSGGWRDLLLCATILSDGLVIDRKLAAWFSRAVIKLYDHTVSVGDLSVSSVLDRLYAVLDPSELASLVSDGLVPPQARDEALRHYVRREADRAADLAARLADEPDLPAARRMSAAKLLADAGDTAGAVHRLLALARDPAELPDSRCRAAGLLFGLEQRTGLVTFAELLRTADLPQYTVDLVRAQASAVEDRDAWAGLTDALAENPALGKPDSPKYRFLMGMLQAGVEPEVALRLCSDRSLPVHLRLKASWWSRKSAQKAAQAAEQSLYCDILADPASSESAVHTAVGASRAADLVERAARDERLSAHVRVRAVGRLVELDQRAAAAECAEALLAQPVSPWYLNQLALVLAELGQHARHRRILLDGVRNAALTVEDRVHSARALAGLGETDSVRDVLADLATAPDISADDRLLALAAMPPRNPAAECDTLAATAGDPTLPSRVRQEAARRLLHAGRRDQASVLLRRITADPFMATAYRIRALTELAEVDVRGAAEALHQFLDDTALLDEHLWQLLELADALHPDVTLRERLHALLGDETVPAASVLAIESHCQRHTAVVPLLRAVLDRLADDPGADPEVRAEAAARTIGLVPYPRWKNRMTGLSPDPLRRLSLHTAIGSRSSSGIYPAVWEKLSFNRAGERYEAESGALAGVDTHAAVAEWLDLVARRRTTPLTELRFISHLMREPSEIDRLNGLLLAWAGDPAAPLADRISALHATRGNLGRPWYDLAAAPTTPPRLRVALCRALPTSGALNRIPLTRTLATDPSCPPAARAVAATLLAKDLGAEGRDVLLALSSPHTTDPASHLAAASAWEELDIGSEAVAAYRRILDDDPPTTTPGHRVTAAQALIKYRAWRPHATRTLTAILNDPAAPTPTRLDSAQHLITAHATAEAHLGLLRLTRATPHLTPEDRARALRLLPPDLHPCATAPTEEPT
ncbi:trypsin-like peptidase domain-containing protein [Streptomyces sp. NPDC057877]|uniref:trypsin-like peptidase domain-containing protein n=1 Tax=Streptomyces sp. NPDC057877 TaxID=3346269 RepID=UPI0036C6F3E8